jgi:hypothetical protein
MIFESLQNKNCSKDGKEIDKVDLKYRKIKYQRFKIKDKR